MPIGDIEENELYIKDPTNLIPQSAPKATPEEALLLAWLETAFEDATIIHDHIQNRLILREEWEDAIEWIMTENHEIHGFDWLINSLSRIDKTPNEIRRAVANYRCPVCSILIIEKPCLCVTANTYESQPSIID